MGTDPHCQSKHKYKYVIMILESTNKVESEKGAKTLHAGSEGEGDEVVNQLGNSCAKRYFELEDCLAEHNRDWKKCQKEVKALKECGKREEELKNKPLVSD